LNLAVRIQNTRHKSCKDGSSRTPARNSSALQPCADPCTGRHERCQQAFRQSLDGGDGNDSLTGSGDPSHTDLLIGGNGNDWIHALSGRDTLWGGAGNDTLQAYGDGVQMTGGTGNDFLYGSGSMTAFFNRGDGQDTLGQRPDTAFGNNTLQFGTGITKSDIDVRVSGSDLVLSLRGTTDSVTLRQFYAASALTGPILGTRMTGAQIVRFADGSKWTLDDLKAIVFAGTAGNDSIRGTIGSDTLSGGLGADTLIGYEGSDTYIVDSLLDQVIEQAGAGTDTVVASVSGWTLGTNTENLTLSGSALTGTGNAQANLITGNDLANTIYGVDGNDTIHGLAGNDWLDGGYGSNTIDGGAGNDTIIGSMIHADSILGGDGNDSINGGFEGADTILGGAGNDTISANGNAMITGGAGSDILRSLGASTFVFNRGDGQDVISARTDTAIGSNTLQFGAGITQADVAVTLSGNDLVLSLRGTTDSVTLNMYRNPWVPMQGADLGGRLSGAQIVRFADGSQWGPDELRTLALTGTASSDLIRGSYLADTLNGSAGNDTLIGYEGSDTYIVDSLLDQVIEQAGAGTDTVVASVSGWTLGTNTENLTLSGSALTGTGNAQANLITGNDLANTIYGVDGNDTIHGLAGNDWLDGGYGSNTIDGGAGNDTIIGSMIHADSILGGDGNDSINGGFEGADTILGGAGNDTISANGNAMITGGAGSDILRSLGASTFVFNRGDGQDVISARTDTAIGSNTLQFGAGITQADVAVTLSGNDLVLSLRGTTDSVTLNMYRNPWVPMQGADLGGRLSGAQIVRFADGSQWGPDELRTLALTGTASSDLIRGSYLADTLSGMEGSDTLLGYEGDDWLDGGSWMDVMYGGTGNDTYVVNHMDDQTIEFAGEGVDTVLCSVKSWTLGTDIENLKIISTTVIAESNALNNTMIGSAGMNEIYGLDGNDTIYGMGGNDIVSGGAGNNLVYGGDGNDTVAGSDGNDLLSGDGGDDRLYAGSGQNTLQGGTGNDTIWAGTGSDTYLFSRGDGIDLVVESQNTDAASDQLLFQSGIGHDQLWLSRSGNNLQISVIGTSDQVTIQDWYLGQAGHVEQIRTSTGRVLLDTKVDALVSAMAAMVPPAAGQTSLTAGQQMLLAPVLAASWS
jgi:Ca2+-binding RTX toxin-like protein